MIDNLMQDARLLLQVREQIKLLTPVLLSVAQADPRFFSERQHHARQFLDRLTHRSLGYISADDAGVEQFLTSVSEAVTVLTGGQGDSGSFSKLLQELEDDWSLEDAAQRLKNEEAARALMHAEQRNLLAQDLADEFEERLKTLDVQELVSVFLLGPWAQVVAESRLGGGG